MLSPTPLPMLLPPPPPLLLLLLLLLASDLFVLGHYNRNIKAPPQRDPSADRKHVLPVDAQSAQTRGAVRTQHVVTNS